MTKLRILIWGSYPGLFGWILNVLVITCVFIREKQGEARGSAGKGKAEIRVMQLQPKEHQQPPKLEEAKNRFSTKASAECGPGDTWIWAQWY